MIVRIGHMSCTTISSISTYDNSVLYNLHDKRFKNLITVRTKYKKCQILNIFQIFSPAVDPDMMED